MVVFLGVGAIFSVSGLALVTPERERAGHSRERGLVTPERAVIAPERVMSLLIRVQEALESSDKERSW